MASAPNASVTVVLPDFLPSIAMSSNSRFHHSAGASGASGASARDAKMGMGGLVATLTNRGDTVRPPPGPPSHPPPSAAAAKAVAISAPPPVPGPPPLLRLPDPSVTPVFRPRHPLQNSWTLWFFKNDRSRSWEDNQRPVLSVQTVEDFWAVVNHIELASKLQTGCDYSFFKDGVKPMWEDDRNRRGGRWLVKLDKKQRSGHLDNFWLEVLLCLIGEAFGGHGWQVNGAVVAVRNKSDRVGVWLADSSSGDAVMHVGRVLKERLGIDGKTQLGFEAHQDNMKKAGSAARTKYTL